MRSRIFYRSAVTVFSLLLLLQHRYNLNLQFLEKNLPENVTVNNFGFVKYVTFTQVLHLNNLKLNFLLGKSHSQLSRCSTARSSGFCLVGPTKVRACKSFLFNESFLK